MAADPIAEIVKRLYRATPPGVHLFHYTSISSMCSIVRGRCLRATDIRYVSDAAELHHLMRALRYGAVNKVGLGQDEVIKQFTGWISDRLPAGNMLFAASFSAQGNLLSQWRAYTPKGTGVSLGFSSNDLLNTARRQSFMVGRCIYDHAEQTQLASEIIDAVIEVATRIGPSSSAHPTEAYYPAFQTVENSLLQVGALFKHGAFREEEEWRAVSPVLTSYVNASIEYREGPSMLVPYVTFRFSSEHPIPIGEVFVGPTPHENLAMRSVGQFFASEGASPHMVNSSIPYRTW